MDAQSKTGGGNVSTEPISASLAPPRESLAVSVVVPTFNRCASLLRLLESLERQTLLHGRFEVVVVDNNSTDGTRDAVLRYASGSRTKVRLLSEPLQGPAHARNRGIRESSAAILAFTDDDIEAEPQWLEKILQGFDEHAAQAVGGRAIPVWEVDLPDWWMPTYEHIFVRNWGDQPCEVSEVPFFYSLNLSIPREVLSRVGLFNTRFGPQKGRYLVGEDVDLCRRIHHNGGHLYYLPQAVVRHHIPAERLTRRFLRRRYYARGVTLALHRAIEKRPLEMLYQAKRFLVSVPEWLAAGSPAERFHSELQARKLAGYLAMAVRLHARYR